MNGLGEKRLWTLWTLALPFIAIGSVHLVQGDEAWSNGGAEEFFKVNSVSATNLSSRSFPDALEKTIDIPGIPGLGSESGSKPAVVAYHRSLHNVSWAVTIPLFSFYLPTANSGDPVNIANQAIYGVFAAIIVIIGFGIPILFNGNIPGARSLENNKITLNHLMHPGHLMNIVGANFQNQVGIDPMQCLQKTVCEAHRSPQNERYGVLALPFQYFFPARKNAEAAGKSVYTIAAREGKFTDTDCRKKYECMFDVLDLATYYLTMYQRAKKRTTLENRIEEGDEQSEKFSFR
ncbi:unnamed protein product [Orchesella dallaii]|uniref:Uncharacterized protein n=1 Tax=Orchesella dallaii TaxID=48710 RepID=A0ABP1QCW5_9HEXA